MAIDWNWRHAIILLLVFGPLALVFALDPISQNLAYHNFADQRVFVSIPHAQDVLSNLPFLLVGILGLVFVRSADVGPMRTAWLVFFAGVALVSAGSAYYHWAPNNNSLVWDRLPMTIGFMGVFVGLIGEYVSPQMAKRILFPAVLTGFVSVAYWAWADDLRLYLWVQFMPLLTIPILMFLFKSRYSHGWMLLVALGWYVLAKVAEVYDLAILNFSGEIVSGHTVKHLLAAIGCYSLYLMLRTRSRKQDRSGNLQASPATTGRSIP